MTAVKIALFIDDAISTKNFFDCLLVNQDSFLVSEIRQMDVDGYDLLKSREHKSLDNSLRIEESNQFPWTFIKTHAIDLLLMNVDFVVCQLKHEDDNKMHHFFKFICEKMEQFCPDAWLINRGSKIGMLTQYIHDNFSIKSVGISDTPHKILRLVKHYFGEDATMEYIGTNNQGYVTSIKDGGGMEHIDKLIFPNKTSELQPIKKRQCGFDALEIIGALPTEYLMQVVQMEENKLLENQDNNLGGKRNDMHSENQDIVFEMLDAIYNNCTCVHIVNTPNNGALKFMKDSDIVEIASHIGRGGIIPLSVEYLNNPYIIQHMVSNKKNEKIYIEKIAITLNTVNIEI